MMAVKLVDILYKEKSITYHYERNIHPEAELYYLDRGAVHIVVDNQLDFVLEQGEACVFLPNQPHSAWAEAMNAPNILDIHFLGRLPEPSFLSGRKFALSDEERRIIRSLIRENRNREPLHREMMESLLSCLLLSLTRRGKSGRGRVEITSTLSANLRQALTAEAKRYIEAHLRDHLSIKTVARQCKVSPSHLSHTFNKVEESGIMEYVTAARIALAKDLLRSSKLSVTEIAEEVGFSSIHYFSRIFKAKTGFTPSQYSRSLL